MVCSTARDARVTPGREVLTVEANATADTKITAATAAYKARQEGILDKVANEISLGNKLVVPAGGYLVLAADLGKAGITASSAKLAEKVSAASKLYNTMGLGLQLEGADLDNFFRNGGTLNLGYADITAATGSGHDDSKAVAAVGHADDTGYAGATTNVYAAGALIINEIMWGLNGVGDPTTGSQYIELHNPGTVAINIDLNEWVIAVGSLPTGYTVIDTVGNNPATGYWAVPGNGGVTAARRSISDGHRPRVYVSCNGCNGWNCRSELGSVHASECQHCRTAYWITGCGERLRDADSRNGNGNGNGDSLSSGC